MCNQVATGAGKAFTYSTGAGGRSHLGAGARLSRTAQAGGGSHLADQEASDAGKAYAYDTGAGGSLRMTNQEATGADKAFAHGTSAGGRSHFGAGARLSRTVQVREVARTYRGNPQLRLCIKVARYLYLLKI